MLKIEIQDAAVEADKLPSGQMVYRQYAMLATANGEVRRIRIPVKGPADGHPAGVYTLRDDSFYVGQWGDLKVSPRLQPIAAAQRTA